MYFRVFEDYVELSVLPILQSPKPPAFLINSRFVHSRLSNWNLVPEVTRTGAKLELEQPQNF